MPKTLNLTTTELMRNAVYGNQQAPVDSTCNTGDVANRTFIL